MRLIGTLDHENQARVFSDYLTSLKIENQVMADAEQRWTIWIHWEDHVESARVKFQEYLRDPDNPQYHAAAKTAAKIRREQETHRRINRTQYIDARTQVFYRGLTPRGNLTLALIAISVAITLMSRFGADYQILRYFLITEVRPIGNIIQYAPGLPEIMSGQVWRLFTPMFIHFGFLHILFNLLWLNDLGSMIEAYKGKVFLIVIIFTIAVFSNVGQYVTSGPNFGGMSGVVYGLLGYVWMKGKFDPLSKLGLDKRTVTMMIVWFFLCFTGIFGPIGNTAHTVGLVMGVVWGFLEAKGWRRLGKPKKLFR